MRNFKTLAFAGLTVTAAITFNGCVKQNSTPANKNTAPATASAAPEESVLTPAGYMPKSKVHFIEKGYQLNIDGGHYQKVEIATGKMVEDFGEVNPVNENIINIGKGSTTNGVVPAPSGWITYASWSNDTTKGTPINLFNTSWVVPKAPITDEGQTLFLFNGMQDGFTASSHILQPVMQWGPSAAGGGSYWSITNWYVGSSAFYGTLETVTTGTKLKGVMKVTGHSGKLFSYNSSFVGYPAESALQVNHVPQMWWAAETLETYGATKSTDYPATVFTKMNAIEIRTGPGQATLNWIATKAFSSGSQNTVIVSNASPGGEVDIYYRK